MELTRHRSLTAAGIGCLTGLIVVGLAVRDSVPGLDAWVLRMARSATGSGLEQAATVVSGVSTLLGITTLVAAAGIMWLRQRGAALATLLRSGLLFVVCCLTVLLQDVFQRQGPTLGEHFLTDVVGAVSGTAGVGVLAAMALRMLPIRHGGGEPEAVSA